MKIKRRKSSGLDYAKLTPIQVYDYLVAGRILKFPNSYLNPGIIKQIMREVILKRQKLTREEICKNINCEYLRKHKLGGAIKKFNNNTYNLIDYCFPEMNIKYWELNKVGGGFWEEEQNRKEFMLWIAKKENIDLKSLEDLRRIDAKLIEQYGGSKALRYGGGVFSLIHLIAEFDVKEWQFIKISVWTEEKAIEAVKWLIEERLKWSYEDVVNNISVRTFYENDLGGLLSRYCNHSPIKALNIAYPGKYPKLKNSMPEQLKKK